MTHYLVNAIILPLVGVVRLVVSVKLVGEARCGRYVGVDGLWRVPQLVQVRTRCSRHALHKQQPTWRKDKSYHKLDMSMNGYEQSATQVPETMVYP